MYLFFCCLAIKTKGQNGVFQFFNTTLKTKMALGSAEGPFCITKRLRL